MICIFFALLYICFHESANIALAWRFTWNTGAPWWAGRANAAVLPKPKPYFRVVSLLVVCASCTVHVMRAWYVPGRTWVSSSGPRAREMAPG